MRFTTPTTGTPTTKTTTKAKTTKLGKTLGALVAASALVLAACGNGKGDTDAAAAETAAQAPAAPAPAEVATGVVVNSATTGLGDILVGQNGMTLYGFTNDTEAKSTCSGTCADAWPPLLVGPDWEVGPGLDSGIFSTIPRDDGTQQLMAGKWPLYYYSGDTKPGDLLGQGSGDVWFVVGLDATLVKDPPPAPGTGGQPAAAANSVQVSGSPLGEILTDGEGNTLYGFTNDADGAPTCTGDCAATWPAHLVEGEPVIGPNLDPATFTLVDGAEGGTQLKAGKWPLYRFSGDAAPGDVNGQGSGGVWFVVAADGSLIKDTPSADPAPADDGDNGGY